MPRKKPVRHKVRSHKKKNGTAINSYFRGLGTGKNRSKVVKITHKEYIYGDFDKDGTPNIDDVKPFDPKAEETVEEVELTDEFRKIDSHAKQYEKSTKKLVKDLETQGFIVQFRIKSRNSIINKLRRKHLEDIQDIGGSMVLVDTEKQAHKVGRYVEDKYDVMDKDDYYAKPKKGYKALHYTVLITGLPHEIQIKTKEDYKQHLKWHKAYKKGNFTPSES